MLENPASAHGNLAEAAPDRVAPAPVRESAFPDRDVRLRRDPGDVPHRHLDVHALDRVVSARGDRPQVPGDPRCHPRPPGAVVRPARGRRGDLRAQPGRGGQLRAAAREGEQPARGARPRRAADLPELRAGAVSSVRGALRARCRRHAPALGWPRARAVAGAAPGARGGREAERQLRQPGGDASDSGGLVTDGERRDGALASRSRSDRRGRGAAPQRRSGSVRRHLRGGSGRCGVDGDAGRQLPERHTRPLPALGVAPAVEGYTRTTGDHVVGSAVRFGRFGWTILVEESYDEAFAPSRVGDPRVPRHQPRDRRRLQPGRLLDGAVDRAPDSGALRRRASHRHGRHRGGDAGRGTEPTRSVC